MCAAVTVGVYLFFTVIFRYIAPFAIGFLISLVFEPIVSRVVGRFRVPRGLMALLCILAAIFIIGGLGTLIGVRIVNEARALALAVPGQLESISDSLGSMRNKYSDFIGHIPEELRATGHSLLPALTSWATDAASGFVRRMSTSVVRIVPGTFVGVILCFISLFFFIKDHDRIHRVILEKSPSALARGYASVKSGVSFAVLGYIRAQGILMSITLCIALTGLSLLRYPYALFLALIISCFDFLPVFGPGFILWPWALGCAVTGDYPMALGLITLYGVIILARQLSEPKILGSQLGVHPLITLMSIFVGLKVFGGLGFLIGPFTVIIIKALYEA